MIRKSLLSVLVLFTACASRHGIGSQGATVVSSSSLYLRNTFDTDPSTYVGRFVPAGVTDLDESNTLILACSKHIKPRFIDGGGVEFTEKVSVSTQVAAKIGIPVIADASASHSQSRSARAQYRLTGKIVAEIPDPDAFAACCKAQPDQCTDRFIGEFIQGTGTLAHEAARETKIDASGTNPQTGISGAGGLDNSAEWQRLAEFAEPVYFAFKTNPTAYTQGTVDTCPSWANEVPRADGGVYVVGRTDNARSERGARDGALAHANSMAMQAAGLGWGSLGNAPVALRAEEWCVVPSKVRRSTRYSARVLAFVSDAAIAEAKKTAEARAIAEREAEEREAARQAEAAARQPTGTTETPTSGSTGSGSTPAPAPSSDAERILAAVRAESFSADQLSALELSARSARVSAAEARQVIDLFASGKDKLAALKLLRDKITDPANWSVIVDGFTFSGDREQARKLAP